MAVEVERSEYTYHPDFDFCHNPLHDLESLWWIGVWFAFWHYKPSSLLDATVQQHMKVVKQIGQTLFNNGANTTSRRRALLHSTLVTDSAPKNFPDAVQYLVAVLQKFRLQLV